MAGHAVVVLSVGLAAAERQRGACDTTVWRGARQRSEPCEMRVVARQIAVCQRRAEDVRPPRGERIDAFIDATRDAVGQFVVVAEKAAAAENHLPHVLRAFPVVVQRLQQIREGDFLLFENKLTDDSQRIDEIRRPHEIRAAATGQRRAAARCAFGAFDTAIQEQRRQHIAVPRPQVVEHVAVAQNRVEIVVELLFVNRIETVEVFAFQDFRTAFRQRVRQ